ncbi:chalcone isomerase family protein [Burkholderiaceae bacterium DAT-1]|nr:chalcone isomerase family protein [Burkholderiaceae bacterium DAT-1]
MFIQSLLRHFKTAALLCFALPVVHAAVELDGMSFEDTVTVESVKLQLNGVGWRKRGYNKVDISGLYLPQKATTLEALEAMPGPKRIQLALLQEISGSTASRYFLNDFEASATKEEFGQVINEVFQMGAIYNSLPKIKKGDIVAIDVIPGKGVCATINGNPIMVPGTNTRYINSDLMGKIFLRMYVGGKTPAELRNNLLGVSRSMRDAGK